MQKGSTHKKSTKQKIAEGVSEYWNDLRKYHSNDYDKVRKKMSDSHKNNEQK